jgi:hypothetical protein
MEMLSLLAQAAVMADLPTAAASRLYEEGLGVK